MANEKDNKLGSETVTMTRSELTQLLIDSQERMAKTLGDALIESRKPYVDPAQEENARRQRQQMHEAMERTREQRRRAREWCQHQQGMGGRKRGEPGSAFVTHQLDTGLVVGLCTNCGKVILSTRLEDQKWFAMATSNSMSASGHRFFIDPVKAMKEGICVDERDGSVMVGS